MGVSAGLYMYDVIVEKFTFAISSPDEFFVLMVAVVELHVCNKEHFCRFDNTEVLGCRISVNWYRDVRKAFHSGMLFLMCVFLIFTFILNCFTLNLLRG